MKLIKLSIYRKDCAQIMAYLKVKKSDLTFGNQIGEGGFSTVYKATWRRKLWQRPRSSSKEASYISTKRGRDHV